MSINVFQCSTEIVAKMTTLIGIGAGGFVDSQKVPDNQSG